MVTVFDFLASCVIWGLSILTVLPFLVATLCYRILVSKVLPLTNSNVAKIVPARSAMFLSRDSSKDYNLGAFLGVEGSVDLVRVRQNFLAQVVLKVDLSGRLLRPELQQFPVLKLGYYFWEWEKDFKIENHIKLLETDPAWDKKENKTAKEILDVIEDKVLRRPWVKGQSPWELYIVNGFEDKPIYGMDSSTAYSGTMFFLRIHHALGDAATLGSMCHDWFSVHEGAESNTLALNFEKRLGSRGYKSWLSRLFFGPLNFQRTIKRRAEANKGYLRSCSKSKPLLNKSNVGLTPTIPLEIIKQIRRSQEVSFTAVIYTLFVRAYARFILTVGYDVPDQLVCASTLKVPGHSVQKMKNHHTMLGIVIPLQVEDAELFKVVELQLQEAKSSGCGELLFEGIRVVGSLCVCLRDHPSNELSEGVFVLTNSAISETDIWLEEGLNRLRTVFAVGTIQAGGTGLGCVVVSVKDGVRVVLQLDESIISREERSATLFAQFFMEEVEAWSGGNAV